MSVDLVRVFAMALMVQGHTLDVLLTPNVQDAPWYNFWLFCRGFTAPMFMTLAGFSFALATTKKWGDHLNFGAPVWKRLRRFAFFVMLGYMMRFPVHSVRDLRFVAPEPWLNFLQVDVLQTTGLTLIVLELLVVAIRDKMQFARVSFGLSLLVAFGAPLAWNSPFVQSLSLPLRSALTGTAGALFPMVPWSAYLFFGAAIGMVYTTIGKSQPSLLRKAVPFAFGLILAGVMLEKVSLQLYGDSYFWPTTPHLFLTRIGFVITVLGLATYIERFIPRPATVRSLAEESLLVYFVHVSLLYGSMWTPGVKQFLGGTMGFAHAYVFVLALVTLMMMMAFYWNRAKKTHPWPSFALRTAIFAAAVIAIS